jgi:hypothetical protein
MMKSMRVAVITLSVCTLARAMAFADVPRPDNSRGASQDLAVIPKPDLAVALTMKSKRVDDPARGACDLVNVDYAITNKGLTPVGVFKVVIEKKDVKRGWQEYIVFSVPELGIGKSTDGQCGRLKWCPGDRSNVGFRVTVDSEGVIAEFDETNNGAEAVHPSDEAMKELLERK